MSWTRVQRPVRCDRCPTEMFAGEWARFGDVSNGVWCVACAARCLLEAPPSDETPCAPAPSAPPSAPEVPAALFEDLAPTDRKFRSADARRAFERMQDVMDPRACSGGAAPDSRP